VGGDNDGKIFVRGTIEGNRPLRQKNGWKLRGSLIAEKKEATVTKLIGEKVLMRIFLGESDKIGHRPVYEALVELFRKEGFAGATVIRGISGFGAHSVYHTDKILRLSIDLPIIVEVVDEEEKLDAIMPQIDEMMNGGGMITLEKTTVIRYTHRNEKPKDGGL